jgi:hypothetical protein
MHQAFPGHGQAASVLMLRPTSLRAAAAALETLEPRRLAVPALVVLQGTDSSVLLSISAPMRRNSRDRSHGGDHASAMRALLADPVEEGDRAVCLIELAN